MTTLPQTTAIRLPRHAGSTQLAPAGANGVPALAVPGAMHGGGGTAAGAMTGSDVWRVIRSHMWLIILMLAVSAIAGYFVNLYLSLHYPRYTAIGYIQVQPIVRNPVDPREQVADPALLAVEQKTQAQSLLTEALLVEVLQNNSSEIRDTTWFKKFNNNIAAAMLDFQDNYNVMPIPETRYVKVTFTYSNPKDCQTIVREMGEKHIANEQKAILMEGQERSRQLNGLKTKYRIEIQEKDGLLASLRSKVSAQGGAVVSRVNIKENQLENLRREQSTLDINQKTAHQQYEQFKNLVNTGQDPPEVELQLDQNGPLQYLKQQADGWEEQAKQLAEQLGPEHPRVRTAQGAAQRGRQKYADEEATARSKARAYIGDKLRQQDEGLTASKAQVDSQIEQVSQELGEVTNDMVRYFSVESQQKGTMELLKEVEQQLDILESQQQQKLQGKVTWARMPEMPKNQSFPQLKYSLPIAIAIGLVLALGIAFLREMTDTTVRSDRDIVRVGQMALLGIVGDESQDPQAAGARLPLVIFDAPHSMTAEQLRQVRTRLQHAASLDTTRSLLVTSPSPGDGKTTIACNLAAGLALNGRRILLVDGNFRRPEIHKIFAVANEQGFSDVLNGSVAFDDVVQETQVPNLSIMSSGPKPINATEMFESQLLIDFIERALEEFDHVIFDSGPMMVVSESAAMAPRVDGVVTVVRARSNSRGLLQRMRDSLRALRAEHLGVVLNGVRAQGGGYYGRNIKTYYEYQNA
jgi:polysaccharide biosynthesis transport protein